MKSKLSFWCLLVTCQILTVLCFYDSKKESLLHQLGCEPPLNSHTYLNCGRKGILALPDFTEFHPNVTEVNLNHNKIRTIKRRTFSFAPKLEELDLSQNALTTFEDSAFSAFKELVVLRLSHNNITELTPLLLEGLGHLQLLELSHNKLTSLPQNFFAPTPFLTELHLQYNNFGTLSERSFCYLPLLEKLDLQNNGLVTLASNMFRYTPRLHWLSLADNDFEHVPKEAFHSSNSLRSLDLSGNRFRSLESLSFATFRELLSLYLNNLNCLERIEKDAFANMTSLKTLSCSYNQKLRFIHPEAFGSNTSDTGLLKSPPSEKLFLAHNSLSSLPEPSGIDTWMKLASVDLKDNPWRCDCNLRWMTRLKKEISGTARCETPLIHHGRTIDSMSESDFVCSDRWSFPAIVLILTSLVAFAVCCAFAFAVACYKTALGQRVRARCQFSYTRVNPKKECIDLEWDPTADM